MVDERDDTRDIPEESVEKVPVTNVSYHDERGKIVVRPKDYKTLTVNHADVVVMKRFDGITTDHVDWLVAEFDKRGMRDILVCVVDKKSDISNLNEEQMNNYGWFRSKQAVSRDVETDKEES